jgi:hypothetical protein
MPTETLVIRFSGPFPGPLDSPLAKTKRHNPDFDRSVIAPRLEHESVETIQIYLHADLRQKEEALAKVTTLDTPPGRFRPDDELLAFLEGL